MARKRVETTVAPVETVKFEAPKAETRAKCLELCMPYAEKVRLMVLELTFRTSTCNFLNYAKLEG